VEDEPFNQYAFKLILENTLRDFKVELDCAMNGQEGLDMISRGARRTQYDVIFMDINMPVMDGIEATKRLRVMEQEGQLDLKGTHIVMHSAIHQSLTLEKLLFDHILPKPIPVEELREVFYQVESSKLVSERV